MHFTPMGNDMFHKGVLKTYDSESKIGTIYLSESNLELHFSVEDLPNPSIPPQIGERVKCFINEDEPDAKDRAKFIVRLDHKNSRTEKPLNRIFYSEEEDLKAIQERERQQAEEARALEQWQREVEEEVRTRVELEVAQAKKELLEQLKTETESPVDDEAEAIEHATEHQTQLNPTTDEPDTENHVLDDIPQEPVAHDVLTTTSTQHVSQEEHTHAHRQNERALHITAQPLSHAEFKFTPASVPETTSDQTETTSAQDLPEIDDVLVLNPIGESKTAVEQNYKNSALAQFELNEAKLAKVATPIRETDTPLAHHQQSLKATSIDTALNVPATPKLSELMNQGSSSPVSSSTLGSSHQFDRQDSDAHHDTPQETLALEVDHQDSVLQKVKTKLEYKTLPPQKSKRSSTKQFNPWTIVAIVALLLIAGLGYLGYAKYVERKQDQEAKAKLYLLEQQRIIDEQRKKLGKVSDKKVLSEKSLNELLGENRQKD